MGRWLILLFACILLADDERRAEPAPASCELLKTRHLAMQVKLNGHGPYRMIFDTGSPVILISSEAARESNLTKSTKAAAKSVFPGQALLSSIEAGGVRAEKVPAVIIDHPTLKAIEGVTGKIDGIVGHSFFAHFKTTIDYSNSTIAFAPSSFKPADTMETMMNAMLDRNRIVVLAPAAQWGLEVQGPSDDLAGVVVMRVAKESAAAKAGLRVGDRILKIDGCWTDSMENCFRAVEKLEPGSVYPVEISRENKVSRLSVTPQAGS